MVNAGLFGASWTSWTLRWTLLMTTLTAARFAKFQSLRRKTVTALDLCAFYLRRTRRGWRGRQNPSGM